MKGTVKFFNNEKGFGFILGEDGKEYFVHQTALAAGVTIRDNDKVTFDITMGDRGPKAANVAIDSGDAPAPVAEPAGDPSDGDDASDDADDTSDDASDDSDDSDMSDADDAAGASDDDAEDEDKD